MPRPIKALYRRWKRVRRALGGQPPALPAGIPASKSDAVLDALYLATLQRPPDATGRAYFGQMLVSGSMSAVDVARALSGSDEAVDRRLIAVADMLVSALYDGVLGRPASGDELALWTPKLRHVADLAAMIRGIETSEEAHIVQMTRFLATGGIQSMILMETARRAKTHG